MPQIHGPASSAAPPRATIIASSTLPSPSTEVLAPRNAAIPPRMSNAPIAKRVRESGVPRLARFHRPSPRAQRTAKPMAASTTGHAKLPSNQNPASQSRASTPTMTNPMPTARRASEAGCGAEEARLHPWAPRAARGARPARRPRDRSPRQARMLTSTPPHDVRPHAEVMADAAGNARDPAVAAAALEAGSPFTGVDLGHAGMFPHASGHNDGGQPREPTGPAQGPIRDFPNRNRPPRDRPSAHDNRTADRSPRPPAPWRRPRPRRRRERPRRLLQRRSAADPHRLRWPDGVQRARPGALSAQLVVHPDRYGRPIGRPAHLRRHEVPRLGLWSPGWSSSP